jgi:ubiquinone/menaquinone biosynthesis C-methylase UbiE
MVFGHPVIIHLHPGSQFQRGTRMALSEASIATHSPAQVYDACFVPALFQQWARITAAAADIRTGQRVLDVACGTGALTCVVSELVGVQGHVVGLDPNEDMLAVARSKATSVDWRSGCAEEIAFPNATFDAVVSQFGMMFFEDRIAALREMMRVLRPQGRLAITVCDALNRSSGYQALADLLERLYGTVVADAFRSPFALGNPRLLLDLCTQAGIANAHVERHEGKVRFASIQALIATERACVWTLGGMLNDAQFEQLLYEAQPALRPFVLADGQIEFAMPGLIVQATKPA